ncbi:FadR/GntR family transcriptional regulator [Agromyces bracchium]|uniref:FCD domain-containing protein n=1 Tax=Agromyces bracchium TaxID=88376 RepID=A0A6I3M4U2_9MICO|nr:FadR/GntR family transcriptional regulator [Agromyces bracchium]MTH68489.1 FCD domain-containing protein [Agromyces bracchium]
MARKSLVATVADAVLDAIVRGDLAPGDSLPSEAELGGIHDVSRITVREAIKTLQAQGVVRVENGRGSYVNPIDEWVSLDAVLRVTSAGGRDDTVAVQLIEVRRMLETGAAALAASRCDDDDLERLAACVAEMRRAHDAGEVPEFVRADLEFHDIILGASGNVFLRVLFEPLARVLAERRAQTSRVPEIQAHAIDEHARVLEALRTGDAEASRRAMDRHMDQTMADLQHYVLGAEQAVSS